MHMHGVHAAPRMSCPSLRQMCMQDHMAHAWRAHRVDVDQGVEHREADLFQAGRLDNLFAGLGLSDEEAVLVAACGELGAADVQAQVLQGCNLSIVHVVNVE